MLRMIAGILGIMAIGHPVAPSKCEFHREAGSWAGSCGYLFEQTPRMTLAPAKAITTGEWRKGAVPTAVWAGEMTDSGYPNAPVELEIYSGGSGVLRTVYSWLPVTGFSAGPDAVSFQVDTSITVPPSSLDVQIVRRASEILSSDANWNRADNRKCPAASTTWSIYCAIEKASIEVTGGFHHRRPAAEVVRQIVEARSEGRNYNHRLMDYNNDPKTRLEDLRSLFDAAISQLQKSVVN